jgi:hypothetical protein
MDFAYQEVFRMTGEVRQPRMADPDIVSRLPTFRAALRMAVNHSGLSQDEIAAELGIDPGAMSRMLREPRHENARPREFPHAKLGDFCRITGCLGPIQWQAMQLGMEPVQARETRVQRLERELRIEQMRLGAVA